MAFSYDPTHLEDSPLYQVRFKLGDTSPDAARFQDEEINFTLSQHNNDVLSACIDCVKALLPRLASVKEFTVGPYTEKDGANSMAYWTKLLSSLESEAAQYTAPIMMPPTGPPIFYYGMMRNHGAID